MSPPPDYLDPATLARVQGLELRARLVVQGYLSGMHPSPYQGYSVEFAQHREYTPGDDIRHVDWKAYGRTDRHYLKQYEEETNLVCWALLDVSESMRYGSGPMGKYDYAATLTAALAHLVLHQQDSFGLVTFDDRVRALVRPSGQPSQLREVLRVLNEGCGRVKTRMAPILHDFAARLSRRSLVAIVSDFFDEPAEVLGALKRLRHGRHEAVVFHVLDSAEVDFPFEDPTLFHGLEGFPDLYTEPRSLRRAYQAELHRFVSELRSGCREVKMDYVGLRTDANLGEALSRYLAHRRRRGKR